MIGDVTKDEPMQDVLSEDLAGLAAAGPDRSMAGFEDRVMRGIAERGEAVRQSRISSAYRTATVSIALAIGVTAGGLTAATTATQPREVNPFSVSAHLAPSNLLEGRP